MTDTRDVTVEEARKLADDAQRIIGKLCSELRTPRMSVPVQPDDEDVRIVEAAHALKNLATQVGRLTAEIERIQKARSIEVTTVFKRATEAEDERDQQAVMLKDMNAHATALAAERDALREVLRDTRTIFWRWASGSGMSHCLICNHPADRHDPVYCIFPRIDALLTKEGEHVG